MLRLALISLSPKEGFHWRNLLKLRTRIDLIFSLGIYVELIRKACRKDLLKDIDRSRYPDIIVGQPKQCALEGVLRFLDTCCDFARNLFVLCIPRQSNNVRS